MCVLSNLMLLSFSHYSLLILACWAHSTAFADTSVPSVRAETGVRAGNVVLVYESSERGDRVPDFSHCGYRAAEASPPVVPVRLTLVPSGGDDTRLIQGAIDFLATLPIDATGWRGAVQLSADEFHVSGTLKLRGSHIVLRGSIEGDRITTIVATGRSRRPLIVVGEPRVARAIGAGERAIAAKDKSEIVAYVPVGSRSIRVQNAAAFRVGQRIQVVHPSTAQWIAAVGMNTFPNDDGRGSWLDWKPGSVDQTWTRTITAVDQQRIELDAPITSGLDPQLAIATVEVDAAEPTCFELGVEQLQLVSRVEDKINPNDEEHAWDGVRLLHVRDAWVRAVRFKHFCGSAVHVGRDAQRITVADCTSTEPISEEAGWRRHTFYCLGQQSLFLRCTAESGRHDFAVGELTSGPNAFVRCSSRDAIEFSGPIGSWATGVLYDNVEIDGAGLSLTNRETAGQGTGWAAANSMLWNCVAPVVTCRQPPTGFNWAMGVWGEFVGDGIWREQNQFISPDSLYEAQLTERVGPAAAKQVLAPLEMPKRSEPITHPDYRPASMNEPDDEKDDAQRSEQIAQRKDANSLRLVNGWLAIGDKLAVGSRVPLSWWRGSVLESKIAEFGPSVTRFVPGRDGIGYTDDIAEVAQLMKRSGKLTLEHHWGLWYDRRRDDHQMVRRISGDVWPPFYEQPWARSGQGRAWDGLSRYDLTRFNSWYFDRLSQFAEQADANGLILMQSMYFQHNILEAGAHWADFPWRPANCLQDTDFPEPPEYQNRKRVFMADLFYDIDHPTRRDLHTRYIRHCLDTLGKHQNVLFVLGEEFTGPLHFMQFWLRTVQQWENESGRNVLVVLSATRDVQEAILEDEDLAATVDAIDVKYWWYTSDGGLYDPAGGKNLAPRQQLREWKGSKQHSAESIRRSIAELRMKWPQKAVLCSIPGVDPWSVLVAGGSLAELPKDTDLSLRGEILKWNLSSDNGRWHLRDDQQWRLMLGESLAEPLAGSSEGTSKDASQCVVQVDRRSGRLLSAFNANDVRDAVNSEDPKAASQAPVLWRRAD